MSDLRAAASRLDDKLRELLLLAELQPGIICPSVVSLLERACADLRALRGQNEVVRPAELN